MWTALIHAGLSLITGGLGGALLRMLPEVFNFFKQKQANQHELEMMDKQLAIQQAIGAAKLAEVQVQSATAVEGEQDAGSIVATRPIGIKWVDALNSSVRPVVTYWFFGLYAMLKTVMVGVALAAADRWALLLAAWTPWDAAMLGGMLSFWYLGRVIDKRASSI